MEKNIKSIKIVLSIALIILLAYLFKTLSFLFIPLAFGLFLTVIILPVLKWFKKRKIPYFVTLIVILLLLTLGIKGSSMLIKNTAKGIASESDKISQQFNKKLDPLITNSEKWLGIDYFEEKEDSNFIKENIESILTSKGFGNFVKLSLGTAKKLLQGIFMTLFFFFLSLGAVLHYKEKIKLFSGEQGEKNIIMFEEIVDSLSVFLRVKTLISLATGISFTIICYIFNIDFPIFWGFMAFIINYIQLVGSIISTIIVIAFGFLQIEAMPLFILFSVSLTAVQVLFGSILEPIFMGKSFAINTVFIVISIIIWGYLWGISGMILSVPIIVIIKEFLDYSEDYKFLGRMLGAKKQVIADKIRKKK